MTNYKPIIYFKLFYIGGLVAFTIEPSDIDRLSFVRLDDRYINDLSRFDCGNGEMNEYIKDDAIEDQKERISITRLVYYKDKLVGFFSISNASIRSADMEEVDYDDMSRYSSYPALKIVRIAVEMDHQSKGVGTIMLGRIMAIAEKLSAHTGCRLIIVDAKIQKEDSKQSKKLMDFYISSGFKPHKTWTRVVTELREERYHGDRKTVPMYLDIMKQ